MRCQWENFRKLLPPWLQEPVERLGYGSLTELRLRLKQPPQLVLFSRSLWLEQAISKEDLDFCINAASQYSPWAVKTIGQGYITAPGGHRLGICGNAVMVEGACTGFQNITSICIRIARDIPDVALKLRQLSGSTLILGAPGSGKTTLLRDFVRQVSERGPGCIAVLDERGEIFPVIQGEYCFAAGRRTDIMTGYTKTHGITLLTRCMSPDVIAVDEITATEDCAALIHAAWCGVRIIATAHATSCDDLLRRAVYRPIVESGIFDNFVVLQQDKSWRLERIKQ